MALRQQHEIYKRRFGRNLGVALTLGAFVVLLMLLTMAKMGGGDARQFEGFDHTTRPGLVVEDN